jgi:acyl-coenzyme A synthetase/AMP-(fatty) acid ligase
MKILDQLENLPQLPLISIGEKTWTRGQFLKAFHNAQANVSRSSGIDKAHFVVLQSQDPVELYSYLFALLDAGFRVALPTTDLFSGKEDFLSFTTQNITPSIKGIRHTDNPGFSQVELPESNIIAFSSGSTGIPKGILHDFENFNLNADSVSEIIADEGLVNVTFLKPYLVSAISHFLVHLQLTGHLIFEDFDNVSRICSLAEKYNKLGIVGSPLQINSAANFLPATHNPRMFFSSGDVVSKDAIARILKSYPSCIFYSVYGLAELGGRFFINKITSQSKTPWDALGRAIIGTSPSIKGGHIMVDSDFLFNGYVIGDRFIKANRPHDSGDVAKEVDGELYFIGRSNYEVKVLGNKINLTYLETQIKNILGSDELAVIALPDPRFGNLIALVLKDWSGERGALQESLRKALNPKEMPHKYLIIDQFPMTSTMKLDRKSLADHAHSLRQI